MPSPLDLRAQHPAAAARLAIATFAPGAAPKDAESVPVELLARSSEPVDHWYWGPCIHDLAGFSVHKATLPLDYCHDPEEVLGFLDTFDVREGRLFVAGRLLLLSDRGKAVLANARAGVPYEASISFDGPLSVEEVQPGATAEVNGRLYQGPLLIFRKWALRGVAVCPYGYDRHTATNLSRPLTITLTEPETMPRKKPQPTDLQADPPAADPATSDVTATPDPATPETPVEADPATSGEPDGTQDPAVPDPPATPETPPADATQQTDRAAEGRRFIDAFGDRGARWFAEGLTFEEAREKHIEAIQAENTELRARIAALGEAAGDTQPADFQAETPPDDRKTRSGRSAAELKRRLGDRLGSFAAGLKFAARN